MSQTKKSRTIRRAYEIQKPTLLTASQRVDLASAIRLSRGGKEAASKYPEIDITAMPGFAPAQLRGALDRITSVRRELEVMSAKYADVLKKMKDLTKEEKDGVAKLKAAGKEMEGKIRYCAEAETAILKFTAAPSRKPPGIEQMIAKPDDKKWEDKAGDFFGRVAEQLGEEVGEAVEALYAQCKEDLTHTTMVIKPFKIVEKTSSIPSAITKEAGIADVVVGIKEWLAGKSNPIIKRILNFTGDISRWVKGFVERTKIARKATTDLKTALDNATKLFEANTSA